MRSLLLLAAGAAAAVALASSPAAAVADPSATLTGRAVLPAKTFAAGPASGRLLVPPFGAGVSAPFASQPVQGFSALLPVGDRGDMLAMPDNGYGALENSSDFLLRVYRIHPDFAGGGVDVKSFISLRDPGHRIPFTIVNEFSRERLLTGADFDPESLQRDPRDGTLWFGEEFGPSLLHTSADGRILEAPITLPGKVRSPQSPESEESSPQRLMNALDARGRARGATVSPVVSPDANLLADGDPATFEPTRKPETSDYDTAAPPASSEIFDVKNLHSAGFKVVPYTVDDPAAMDKLLALGVDGIISDRSDLLYQRIAAFGGGKYLLPDGRVDPAKFDFEGHRGSRNLRPENTLPAMEAGLDNLINTIETDNAVTKDGVPVLDHEPYVSSVRCHRSDGSPYGVQDEALVKDLTLAQLQSQFTCDNVFRGASQSNDRALSPIAVAFAREQGLRDPYVMPTSQSLFDFVAFYEAWYRSGPGKDDPKATVRADNAAAVRFNIETKVNPRQDRDDHGNVYAQRTIGPKRFADVVSGVIVANKMAARSDVQSFDFRTLLRVQDTHPEIPLVALWGDTPKGDGVDEDGTNLQPAPGTTDSPWLAGMHWPYRQTAETVPFRAQQSGGFEGMARRGDKLLPMLEKTLTGDPKGTTLISEYDTRAHRWTGRTWRYAFDPRGVSIGDFQMLDADHGLTLERDNEQGAKAKFKTIEKITLGRGDGHTVDKSPLVDELDIADPAGISRRSPTNRPGDLLIGDPFGLPFTTIEDLVVTGPRTLVVGVDNNFPFSVGRHAGTGEPDDNEIVRLRLPRP